MSDLIEWLEARCYGLFPEGDEDSGFLGYAVTCGQAVVASGPTVEDAIREAQAKEGVESGEPSDT